MDEICHDDMQQMPRQKRYGRDERNPRLQELLSKNDTGICLAQENISGALSRLFHISLQPFFTVLSTTIRS